MISFCKGSNYSPADKAYLTAGTTSTRHKHIFNMLVTITEHKLSHKGDIIAPFYLLRSLNFAKRTIMNKLPVSKKVYTDITGRISHSLADAPQSASEALRLVDAYLKGSPAQSDDPTALLAFNMIRAELDRAILRSSRARERARARRKAAATAPRRLTTEEIVDHIISQLRPEDFEEIPSPEAETVPLPPTRRERRHASRAKKPRWKSLSRS